MTERNQKVWILTKDNGMTDNPVAAFNNESAAYESQEACQEIASDNLYFAVAELVVRKNKLNKNTVAEFAS